MREIVEVKFAKVHPNAIIPSKVLFISKLSEEETYNKHYGDTMPLSFVYPYSKAIAQALVIPVPKVEIEEISYDELKEIKSERGMGKLGSSNK